MSAVKQTIDISGDGGVKKEILEEGKGTETPGIGCKVSLHYTGKLTDGTIFDSSVERGQPFEFNLGKGLWPKMLQELKKATNSNDFFYIGSVIKAFDLGVATMKLKEKCNLICAPKYAYGESGSPPSIPPNSTLIFEVKLIKYAVGSF